MKKVITESNEFDTVIYLENIPAKQAIIAKKFDVCVGILIKEKEGWILRFTDNTGCTGHHSSRKICIADAKQFGYTFFTE